LSSRVAGKSAGERGQALVEFGLIAVVFFVFITGLLDGARLFQSWMSVQHASREAARYAITGRADCTGFSTRDDCIEYTAKKATTGLERGGSGASDANVTVTYKAWDYDTWSGSGTAGETGNPCDQIEVTVQYTHQFVTPFLEALLPSGVTLKGKQRMTNEPWAQCNPGDGVS
jgi:Flp pilus assembly protein TadG